MIKIAILDDLTTESSKLNKMIENYSNEHDLQFMVDIYSQGLKFLDNVKKGYDIVFFDIDMPVINGLEVAKKLRELDSNVIIIFVTNLAHFAINGYEVNAMQFLVKPISKEQLYICLDKAIQSKEAQDNHRIMVKVKGGYSAISVKELIYIEVRIHSLIYHTTKGVFETRGVLKEVEEQLSSKKFVKCNNCYLVNLDFVNSVVGDEVNLPNEKLQISRNKKKAFVESFLENISS